MGSITRHKIVGAGVAIGLTLSPFALLARPKMISVQGDATSAVSTTTTTTSTVDTTTTSTTTATAPTSNTYLSTLVGGLTPSPYSWGRTWRTNGGAAYTANMVRTLQVSPNGRRVRFELWNTEYDKASGDSTGVRRAELSGSVYGDPTRLPNSTSLWGGFSFKHQSWADPEGMKKLMGGVYGQIHMGSKFGGSPAVAFRRTADGRIRITTRGELDTAGTIRYQAPLSFDQVHDVVYNVVLDPVNGSLRVWIDGVPVVNVSKVSIGSHYADSFFNFGLYFSGGITTPVVAEYANMVYPNPNSLATRVSSKPSWPTDY